MSKTSLENEEKAKKLKDIQKREDRIVILPVAIMIIIMSSLAILVVFYDSWKNISNPKAAQNAEKKCGSKPKSYSYDSNVKALRVVCKNSNEIHFIENK